MAKNGGSDLKQAPIFLVEMIMEEARDDDVHDPTKKGLAGEKQLLTTGRAVCACVGGLEH